MSSSCGWQCCALGIDPCVFCACVCWLWDVRGVGVVVLPQGAGLLHAHGSDQRERGSSVWREQVRGRGLCVWLA
jgi:hypothetical protein